MSTAKHRSAAHRGEAPQRASLKVPAVVLTCALAVTGIAVTGGVAAAGPANPHTTYLLAAGGTNARAASSVSRSSARTALTNSKATILGALDDSADAVTGSEKLTVSDPKQYAASQLSAYGWDSGQYTCLDELWERESHWNVTDYNASSGAYGIPQALPGTKMASEGPDWRTNPKTQVDWGLGYIQGRYGSPCNALAHSNSIGWY